MPDHELLQHIMFHTDPDIGKPVIKGTSFTVEYMLGLLAHGTQAEEIVQTHVGVNREDIQACLLFAARSLETSFFLPLSLFGGV